MRVPAAALHAGVALGVVALYLPFAGTYGLWDPWEPHYAEVARQMLLRGDWISPWWSGAPWEEGELWSKPALPFWTLALSFKAFGAGLSGEALALVSSWRAEWAARLPSILWAALAVWSTFYAVLRLVGRRAALLTALVLVTCPMFFLIARQAMTDMALVACLCAATSLGAVALFDDDLELPRRSPLFWTAWRCREVEAFFRGQLRRHQGERVFAMTWRREVFGPPLAGRLTPGSRRTLRVVYQDAHHVLWSFIAEAPEGRGWPLP